MKRPRSDEGVIAIKIVITGLDHPVIHLLRKSFVAKIDGCPDQVRA
jgi:hypothetical protein